MEKGESHHLRLLFSTLYFSECLKQQYNSQQISQIKPSIPATEEAVLKKTLVWHQHAAVSLISRDWVNLHQAWAGDSLSVVITVLTSNSGRIHWRLPILGFCSRIDLLKSQSRSIQVCCGCLRWRCMWKVGGHIGMESGAIQVCCYCLRWRCKWKVDGHIVSGSGSGAAMEEACHIKKATTSNQRTLWMMDKECRYIFFAIALWPERNLSDRVTGWTKTVTSE